MKAHRKVAVAIQQMWREHLNIESAAQSRMEGLSWTATVAGDYQISRAGWIGDYVDPNNFLDMFLCNGGNNRTGWCNTEYDRLILEQLPRAALNERLGHFQPGREDAVGRYAGDPDLYLHLASIWSPLGQRTLAAIFSTQPSFTRYLPASGQHNA